MTSTTIYESILKSHREGKPLLAVLLDPEKFDLDKTSAFLRSLPVETTHLLVGGSTVPEGMTEALVRSLKMATAKPIILFPGNYSQLTDAADAVLFLSLLSGMNPEYLIGQHIKAVPKLRSMNLEIIPTAYLLIDGGTESAVQRVTQTEAISQDQLGKIVDTAKAGEYMGSKLVYLEAGSGARFPVSHEIIRAVKNEIKFPLIVGGGIRTTEQLKAAYEAGADMVVMGTVFEQ